MHEFIGSLTRNLGSTSTSLADRACQLFDVAMTRGGLRWGRKARLTAAAALALAFREAQRSDPLRDIAVRMQNPNLQGNRISDEIDRSFVPRV